MRSNELEVEMNTHTTMLRCYVKMSDEVLLKVENETKCSKSRRMQKIILFFKKALKTSS